MGREKKKAIAASGPWIPVAIEFLRSTACAELSPHAAKLLLDVLALLRPNCVDNGDLSLTPKALALRGWTSKATLQAALHELLDNGILSITKRGSRTDCMLFAVTLYPLDCDQRKLDAKPGSYLHTDYHGGDRRRAAPPTEADPAVWRRARKTR